MKATGTLATTDDRGSGRRRLALAALLCAPAALMHGHVAAAQPDLYSATVIVTGRDNLAERERGIREALPAAITRLTADRDVAEAAKAKGLVDQPEAFVSSFDYVDRKEGVQISDEQGTRERSFELTVRFDRDKVDRLLGEIGAAAWTEARPTVLVDLTVDNGNRRFAVTRSSELGYGQRLAIDDEARALALPVRLPGDKDAAIAAVTLDGSMTIAAGGRWDTDWHLHGRQLDERFEDRGTSFDEAIGGALRHSAKRLAKR